ncbi:FeoA family protein [Streptococcus porci]|uniref:FeoA family protein n=1 Tax=Streptococcus porci TaxID=502567 RepID=UPI0004249EB2|nr:ferrous iron transport protein A [Streptococcus porci]
MFLIDAKPNINYQIQHIDLDDEALKHLMTLGLKQGGLLKLVAKTKSNAIIIIKGSRLALDNSILERISIKPYEFESNCLALSDLTVGSFAYIKEINSDSQTKRRLMDMGLTKHTKIYLRKVAPLGDPLEISLRGYELTLRKSEAQLITVIQERE